MRRSSSMMLGGLALCAGLVGCTADVSAPAIVVRDAAVVWNPDTGKTAAGKRRHSVSAALADLTNAMAKVTGVVPAVYEEGQEPKDLKNIVYLGDTSAGRAAGCAEGVTLRRGDARVHCVPGRVYLYAIGGMGMNWAMSDFAERLLDYQFLTPEGDDPYTFNPNITIPQGDRVLKADLYYAEIYTSKGGMWGDFARRRRAPDPHEAEGDYRVSYEVRDTKGRTQLCHSSFCYIPPEVWFKDHPEWFSLRNGKRQYLPVGQLCMSNTEMRQKALEKLLEFIAADRKKYPTDYPTIYDFTQQDNTENMCECEACKAIIAKYNRKPGGNAEGGDAGLQLEFINWIAREAAKVYPDVKVRTFAYVSTETPPKPGTIRPADNVVIWWCDLYGRSEHYRPLTDKVFNHLRVEQIGEWMGLAKHIHLWDYMLYGGSYEGDFPEWSPDAIAADAKYWRANNLQTMFMESEVRGNMPQPLYDLNYYLMSRCYTDADTDIDAATRTYCRVYGKGAAKMFEALQFLRQEIASHPAKDPESWHQRMLDWRSRETMTKFRDMVKGAYDLEAVGTSARRRMARILASVSRELVRILGQIPSAAAECTVVKADYARYGKEYLATAPMTEADRKKALAKLQTEVELFDLKFKDMPPELAGVPDAEIKCADYHRMSGSPNGQRVADADSETGQAMVWKLGKPDKEHKGFPVGCGLYDLATKDSYGWQITPELASARGDEKYHWIKLGKGRLGSGGLFWMPGDWHMSFRIGEFYILADGLPVDPNWYELYISAKFTGPAYVKGSTKPNGIWMDRLVLRRVAPPKKK